MKCGEVLLLGGAGFIGRSLAGQLERQGVVVHVVGRVNLDQLPLLLPRCGTVVHLASATTPGLSADKPQLETENLTTTLRLLQQLEPLERRHLIFFSSGGTVYGDPQSLPVAEDVPLHPRSYHGAGKVAQEVLCIAARQRGHQVTILRPSNAFGPGQSLRTGFGLIRTALEHLSRGTALEIWGSGEQIRDYVYIDDVVAATCALIDRPLDSNTYNLGSGRGYSVNQIVQSIEVAIGLEMKVNYRPARSTDVSQIVLDIRRLQEQLAWHPVVELEEGIRRTWAWMQRV